MVSAARSLDGVRHVVLTAAARDGSAVVPRARAPRRRRPDAGPPQRPRRGAGRRRADPRGGDRPGGDARLRCGARLADIVGRAGSKARLMWRYLTLMVIAGVIACYGVLDSSPILVCRRDGGVPIRKVGREDPHPSIVRVEASGASDRIVCRLRDALERMRRSSSAPTRTTSRCAPLNHAIRAMSGGTLPPRLAPCSSGRTSPRQCPSRRLLSRPATRPHRGCKRFSNGATTRSGWGVPTRPGAPPTGTTANASTSRFSTHLHARSEPHTSSSTSSQRWVPPMPSRDGAGTAVHLGNGAEVLQAGTLGLQLPFSSASSCSSRCLSPCTPSSRWSDGVAAGGVRIPGRRTGRTRG